MNMSKLAVFSLGAAIAGYVLFTAASSRVRDAANRTSTQHVASIPREGTQPLNRGPRLADDAGPSEGSTPRNPSTVDQIKALGFFEPLLDRGDESAFRQRDLLAQVLTPTSVEDGKWLVAHGYPRRVDIDAGRVNALLTELEAANPIVQADRVEYLTNAVAASLYQAGDPRWREYSQNSTGSFGAMLELIEMRRLLDADMPVESSRFVSWLARAQVHGEIDATHVFERTGRLPRTDALAYAFAVSSARRQAEYLNARAAQRGQRPLSLSPRPAAPWNGGHP